MANPLGSVDELGGAVRKIIGDLADNRDVYYPFTNFESYGDNYPGAAVLSKLPRYKVPVPGDESGMLSPFQVIARAAYPSPELAERAAKRTLGSSLQSEFAQADHIPLLVRSTDRLPDGSRGRMAYMEVDGEPSPRRAIELAGNSGRTLRTLIHEARHATETDANRGRRALSSVSSHATPGIEGRVLTQDYRRYLANPSEMLAYLGEAGDDFVRAEGRLVVSDRDANTVMEMLEAGDAAKLLHPLSRQLYSDAYKKNPRARANINDILTRYFSAPAAVATQYEDE